MSKEMFCALSAGIFVWVLVNIWIMEDTKSGSPFAVQVLAAVNHDKKKSDKDTNTFSFKILMDKMQTDILGNGK